MSEQEKKHGPNELKETLARRIAKAGEDDFVVKQLRRQIAAEETGLNSRQLFSGHPCILSKRDRRY
jgi:hypothetical protein